MPSFFIPAHNYHPHSRVSSWRKPNPLPAKFRHKSQFASPQSRPLKILFPNVEIRSELSPETVKKRETDSNRSKSDTVTRISDSFGSCQFCSCGRRHFLGASGAAFISSFPASANDSWNDPMAVLNSIHPSRPDWYEESFALAMDQGMKSYEAEIAGYKAELFTHLTRENKKVLELGVGTGPNFKYYANATGVTVLGIDPNKRMEKYARVAAEAAGLPSTHFSFIQAVGEALPIRDAFVDAVIGTLVLCSVKDVYMVLKEVKRVLKPGGLYLFIEHVAAKDGTSLRFLQTVLDPLQQMVSDGCHLTRETGKAIAQAGFSDVDINMVFLSKLSILSPHVKGIACK